MNAKQSDKRITALYARLSRDDEKEGVSGSIQNQKVILEKFAKDNKLPNPRFFYDDGFSGVTFTRPAFMEIMELAEQGLIGTIVVKDHSRLGRNRLVVGQLLEEDFVRLDIRYIAIMDNIDTAKGISDLVPMQDLFNEWHAKNTSDKVRKVMQSKGMSGKPLTTNPPFGYMKNPDNPKQFIPNPETAPIVKRIFEMYASGIGIVKICDKLSKEQILSPGVYAFKTTGSKSGNPDLTRPYHWAQTTVRKMLANQEYAGDTVNFKTYSKSNKLKKRLKNDPESILIFENTHEAIIDRKTFELVQKHFAGRKRPDKQGERDKYAGYLFCGECGSRLYLHRGKTIKPENNNFQCGGFQRRTTDCTAHYIRENVLDQIVLHNLKTVTAFARDQPKEFYAMATQNGEAEAKKFYKTAEREKVQIEKRIKELCPSRFRGQ